MISIAFVRIQRNSRVYKSLVTAKSCGTEIDFDSNFLFGIDNKTPEYLKKFSLGQAPRFETKDGLILTELAAISLYIASKKDNNPLLGQNANETSKIHQYLFFAESSISLIFISILLPYLGYGEYNEALQTKHYKQFEYSLNYLNNELIGKHYLVRNRITIADINLYLL